MNAALARAHAAGVTVLLTPDGKLQWRYAQPITPALRAELRARRAEILAAFKAAEVAAASTTAAAAVIAEAETRGWRVDVRPSGILVDTCSQPADPALMDRLHCLMLDNPVLADPAEVVARGELAEIVAAFGG